MNLGNGPAAVAVNLRVSRSFGVGPKIGAAAAVVAAAVVDLAAGLAVEAAAVVVDSVEAA